jgi:hypothetical protein
MLKWRTADSEAFDEDTRAERHRQQDDDFCRSLRAALYAGTETCPQKVSTKPGTKKPIWNYHPPAAEA